jgi:tetratricopeptide (TPR) repeat protein
MNPETPSNPAEALQAEIARIRSKRETIKDPFIRDALDQKIAHLEHRLEVLNRPKVETEEPEEQFEPPTPKQLQDAEGFVRQARVQKMRGNAAASTELLRKAVEAAPTAPAVLEALADDLLERKQRKEALPLYKKALKLEPRNVGLERKYAMLVLGSSAQSISFDDAMRADWRETPFASNTDNVASPLAATILTVFLPGSGHIVLGKTATGAMILGTWAACCLWIALMAKDFAALAAKLVGKNGGHVNYLVLVPLVIIAIVYIGAVSSLRSPKKAAAGGRPGRPTPPVNLPFD